MGREERERRRRREGARSLPAPMVNSQESVDLQGLLGLLHVSSSTEHETEKENAKSGKTRTTTTATATAAKPRAEDELRGWTTRSNESRRKGGHERSEEYREKGNDLYRIGAYEGAADFYTRAINADPRNEKAYGNRCAAYTLMKLYRKALNDANYGLSLSPSWAKLQSRKAVAHFHLKEYDESVQAYQAAPVSTQGTRSTARGSSKQSASGDPRRISKGEGRTSRKGRRERKRMPLPPLLGGESSKIMIILLEKTRLRCDMGARPLRRC